MIARALVVALSCACAAALAPLTAPADDDCALYLTGPGRSSAYDYSLNLLKGNFGYEGQHTCITYEAINQAYLEARNRILVSQPKGDWKAEDFASVGELLLDISINLARTYGLTYEEIEKGLPLIDTSRTLIREACPPVFSHVECRAGKYRRFDGLCNNLRHPTWGATMAPFQRLIGPLFADGINAPRIAHNGHDLPLSRVVSRTMHPDDGFHDHAGTVMVIAWGQFMDHDYTLTGTPLDPINRNDPEECCKRPPHLKHPYCNEIRVPDDDYFYRLWGVKCIDFVRGFPSPRPGCRLGSRVPFNTLTGSIDGNTVYGVTEKFARKLRTGYGGLLRMNPVFKEYGLKDLLPLKLDIPDEGCTRPNKNMYCFEAGEIRVNEQLVLTVMHTLMAREHNRVAEALAAVNPHWDDETLFQEARRINIAEIQHITYNEFLPILLGKDVMEKFGLVLEKEGYWNGYDPEVNPDVLASFAAAAYRFGHSLLPTAVERWSKAHKFIASKRLSDLIRRPYDLYRAGVLDEYVMGLMNQVAQAMDDSITQEVTNHLFKKIGARFGMDLVSFNMQRGREFGLPGYMEFRKFCGLSGAETFQDLFGSMPNETVRKYESIFEHPIDVDLWSGGVSERPLPGSMLGPTFACIIATQFSYSRRGDRFWFELPNQPSSFTPEQLAEIRKSRLARVICDNTDIIDTVQLYPMVLPDHELNPRVPCRSGIIPSMDFSKWADPVPFHGAAKQFITEANATNKFANCNYSSNKGNVTKGSQSENDIKENNLCGQIRRKLSEKNIKNITSQLQVNQSSQSLNDKLLPVKSLESIDSKEETNNMNLNKNTDSLTKYIYKKTDKANLESKSKGHSKNSISRKKRSPKDSKEPSAFYKSIPSTPYHTSHDERDDGFLAVKSEIINNAALADFNIETVHKDVKSPASIKERNNKDYYSDSDKPKHPISTKKENKNYEQKHHDKVDISGKYKDYPSDIDKSKHSLPIIKDDRSYEQQQSDKVDIRGNYKDYPSDIENSKHSLPIKQVDRSYEQQHRDKVDIDGKFNEYHTHIDNSKHSLPIKKDDRSYEQQHRDKVGIDGNYKDYPSDVDNSKHSLPIKKYDKSYEEHQRDKVDIGGKYNDYPPHIDNSKHSLPIKKEDGSYEQQHRDKVDIGEKYSDYPSHKDNSKQSLPIKKDDRSYEQQHRDKVDIGGKFNDYPSHLDNSKHSLPIKKDDRSYEQQHRDKIDIGGKFNDYPPQIDNPKHSLSIKKDDRHYEQQHRDKVDIGGKYYKYPPHIDDSKHSLPIKKDDISYEQQQRDKIDIGGKFNDYTPQIDNSKHSLPIKKDDRHYEQQHRDKVDIGGKYYEYPPHIDDSKHSLPVKKDDISYEKQHRDKVSIGEKYKDYPSDVNNSKHSLPIIKDDRRYEQQHRDKIDREGKHTYIKDGNYKEDHSDIDNFKHSLPIKKDNSSYEHHDRDKNDRERKPSYIREGNYNERRSNIDNSKHSHPNNEENRSYEHLSPIVDRQAKNTYKPTERISKESDESKEIIYDNVHKSTPLSKEQSNDESNEFSKELLTDYRDAEKSKTINHPKNIHKHNAEKNYYQSNDNNYRKEIPYEDSKSSENSKEISSFQKPNNDVFSENYIKNFDITNPPKRLQDVDLNDFSYERIQVDEKGKVEPLKDLPENYDSSEKTQTTTNPSKTNFDKKNDYHGPRTDDNKPSERLVLPNKQPARINDDEVKPVVELHGENDYSGSSEERPTRYQNGNLRNSEYSSSEEDVPKKKNYDDISENISEKANVKQQFERIPLDYNHDDTSLKETNNKEKPVSAKAASDENVNDGTIDSLAPKTNNYDEHLKTKFGDVSISLPEIKLPDDILSYARIGAPKESEGKYYYADDDSDENPSEYSINPYDKDVKDFYKIDPDRVKDHEDYKKASLEDDDDDVDLYDKFVKERFGKKSTVGKNADKLQTAENRPLNSKLLETVQKILKKTEKVKDEAEKSGDPNAGYMWTLEYGEDL